MRSSDIHIADEMRIDEPGQNFNPLTYDPVTESNFKGTGFSAFEKFLPAPDTGYLCRLGRPACH